MQSGCCLNCTSMTLFVSFFYVLIFVVVVFGWTATLLCVNKDLYI